MALDSADSPLPVAVDVVSEADLVSVRQALRREADRAGLGLVDATKFITAGSELARNILTHAAGRGGQLRIEQVGAGGRQGVRATFTDQGPGIADLDSALADGFSTNGSLGLGLPGSRRLVDELEIASTPGSGTTVVIVKWER